MRLLEIKIKNIASLKGEHTISFREIMGQSPLFAITGETGSGKSSILNSIGLALYGRVFKSSVQQNDVVTLGEKEGQIELLFQAREKTYLSLWRAKVRKQNGELYSTPQSPTRDLYEVNGTDFDDPKQISNKKIEDILHLDYDQFCKCVVLNQGEFARFLSSSFTERKDILEKLYPGDVLEGLSGQLRLDLEECRREKETLEIEMSTLQSTGFSGVDLKIRHEELKKDLTQYDQDFSSLETLDAEFKTLHHYFEKNLESQKRLEAIKNDINQLTTLQNEKLLLVKAAQEAAETSQKLQEKDLPRLQELLKIEERRSGLHDQSSILIKKQTALKTDLEKVEQHLSLVLKNETEEAAAVKSYSEQMTLPLELLRVHEKNLLQFFELTHEKNLATESHLNAQNRLGEIESSGKEKSKEAQEIELKTKSYPANIEEELKELVTKKEALDKKLKEKEKNLILLGTAQVSVASLTTQSSVTDQELQKFETEASPLRTTRKLSSLLTAVSVCRNHEETISTNKCPVCETKHPPELWSTLRESLHDRDLKEQMLRLEEIEKELIQLTQVKKTQQKELFLQQAQIEKLQQELMSLESSGTSMLLDPKDLEEKITRLKVGAREVEGLRESEKKLQLSLSRIREEYSAAKKILEEKRDLLKKINLSFEALLTTLKDLLPTEPTDQQLGLLKKELKIFKDYRERENLLSNISQEKKHLLESSTKLKTEWEAVKAELDQQTTLLKNLDETLTRELAGEKASVKILQLAQKVKQTQDEFRLQESDLKKHELLMKGSSSNLLLLNEQLKDLELQFIRSRDVIRQEALKKKLSDRETLNLLHSTLKTLALDFSSPPELFIPVKELLLVEKEHFAKLVANLKDELSATIARLADWEKRQDKITLLALKNKDLMERLGRLERLYDVLGKDELRTFVLSLVEENLIEQTNEELQKLCQGRYEIVHQSRKMKLTPEFYVLDKFREGGLRKVATLSGGETFMVSLAMALALAEMTRGQAEIDSLFIDEGFGTLDQDSLEDVLEMLNQIQTRGLMVGIISHIKALTNALPVNLLLSKRQDGTSTLSLQYN